MSNKSQRRWRTSVPKQICARQLRQTQTLAESQLWEQLRGRRLDGWKFRRQHPVDRFIVDFYCAEQRLVVEVDGSIHAEAEQAAYDLERSAILQAAGYRVIRFSNEQICSEMPVVLQTLRAALGRQ
ncbi:MAG: endonuclease domain-containing protein [Candidatus Viridilinea halotolerans]|uniref:Endonuclease domain-containing protein n=1 Tax=Candidatus Viridilinea halotolerans TaxID=2491704 RepID=A0A426TR88_9CHLR|nr:MAG: endonuclease domain-containing protein [Candidatus Viridilinea halotolerans]